jgi:starch phosphorylase
MATGESIQEEPAMADDRRIAYFSMEIGLEPAMPTYSGGLGVLAGDTLRSAADHNVPMVGLTLLDRKGYFHQRLDPSGRQTEEPEPWAVEDFLERQPARVWVVIEGRTVHLAAWKREVKGIGGYAVPVYFLDADLLENSDGDRRLTDYLYGGDAYYRICQEVLLGIGGVRMLRALGYSGLERYHMNEGHAALLALELLDEHAAQAGRTAVTREDVETVRRQCVFTTHTPVAAGTDKFPMDMVARVLGEHEVLEMEDLYAFEGVLNMTYLALNLSHYVNGVAKRHGEVSRLMFAPYTIDSITNGVHAGTWMSKPFQDLVDRHIPGWRGDNFSLRYALSIPKPEVWAAHAEAKRQLIDQVNRRAGAAMDPEVLTLGFARRATAYKRADLLFHDLQRLRAVSSRVGRLQVVYAGKAHPRDQEGKEVIQHVFQAKDALAGQVEVAYLENYDMALGQWITSGVDVWLNTPEPPQEASGTSGMKAALNGVPSLSILDGWWIEGCIEGVTGWAIGQDSPSGRAPRDRSSDAASLYDKLEKVVIPLFYGDRDRFIDVMRHAIALNGSFFNTQRMILQYVLKAYFE